MKIFALTYNELIKQFKGKGTKALLAVLLVLAVALPVAINVFPKNEINQAVLDTNEYMLNNFEAIKNKYEKQTDIESKVNLATAIGDYEAELLRRESNINANEEYGLNEWRDTVTNEYKVTVVTIEAIKLIMAGIPSDVLMPNIYNVNVDLLHQAYNSTAEEQQTLIENLENKKIELKRIVMEEDYLTFLKNDIDFLTNFINEQEKEIQTLKTQLSKNPNDEILNTQLKVVESNVETQKDLIKVLQYRYDNKIDFKLSNWKNKTLKTIEQATRSINELMLTEEEYQRQASMSAMTMTYEQYKQNFELNQVELQNTMTQHWYSLEKNIPQQQYVTDARIVMDTVSSIFIIAASVIVIILGGGIVANEFSTGTIRLLLIRPVSRGKILASKLLSLFVIGFSIVVVTTLVSMVTSGIIFGFDTLTLPVLEVANNVVIEQNFMMILLSKMALESLSLIFIMALVFSLSTLTKNTAVAVALSIVIYLGAVPATLMIAPSVTLIGNTFIPFINHSMLTLSGSALATLKEQSGVTMNATMGLIQLMILAVILIGGSIVVFKKKDVKN